MPEENSKFAISQHALPFFPAEIRDEVSVSSHRIGPPLGMHACLAHAKGNSFTGGKKSGKSLENPPVKKLSPPESASLSPVHTTTTLENPSMA